MKPFFRILAAFLALVLCLLSLASCASVTKPLFYLKKVLKNSIEESAGGELVSFLLSSLEGGSVSVDFGGTDLADTFFDSAKLKGWFDVENNRLAAQGEVVIDAKSYSGSAWVDPNRLVVKSPSLFGSTTLGIDFNTLEEDLKNSIFSNNSGTAYAKTEVSESTAKSVNEMKDGIFSLLSSGDDWLELCDEVLEVFLEQLTEQAYNNRYREGGRSYVSLSVNNDTLSRTIRETRNVLVKDRSFCREMRKLAQTRDAMESAKSGVVTNTHSTELEYFLSSSSDIDELCLKIDAAAPFELAVSAKIKNAGDRIEAASVVFTENGVKRLDASLVLGDEGDTSTLCVVLDGVSRTFTYCVDKDNFRAYEADFSYCKAEGGQTVLSLQGALTIDRKADAFTLSYTAGGIERIFEGECELNAKHLFFCVDEVRYNGEARFLDLEVEVKRSERIPQLPEYKNIITINSTAYAPIEERANGVVEQLKQAYDEKGPTPYTACAKLLGALGLEAEIPTPEQDMKDGWWRDLLGLK